MLVARWALQRRLAVCLGLAFLSSVPACLGQPKRSTFTPMIIRLTPS